MIKSFSELGIVNPCFFKKIEGNIEVKTNGLSYNVKNAICRNNIHLKVKNLGEYIYKPQSNDFIKVISKGSRSELDLYVSLKRNIKIKKVKDQTLNFDIGLKNISTKELYLVRYPMVAVDKMYSSRSENAFFYRNLNNPYACGTQEDSEDVITEPIDRQLDSALSALPVREGPVSMSPSEPSTFKDLGVEASFSLRKLERGLIYQREARGFSHNEINAIVNEKKLFVLLKSKNSFKVSVQCHKMFKVNFLSHNFPVGFSISIVKNKECVDYKGNFSIFRIFFENTVNKNRYHVEYKLKPIKSSTFYQNADNKFFHFLNNPYYVPKVNDVEEDKIVEYMTSAFAGMAEQVRPPLTSALTHGEAGPRDRVEESAVPPDFRRVDGTWSLPTTGLFTGASYADLLSSEGKENALWSVNQPSGNTVGQAKNDTQKVPEVDRDLSLPTEALLSADSLPPLWVNRNS